LWTAGQNAAMRWEGLFADLEGQAEALERAERAAEVETRARGEVGRLAILDRLRAALDTPLRLRLAGGADVTGVLRRVGPDWLLVDEGRTREVVVVTGAILGVTGLGRYSAVPGSAGVVESRLSLRHALRGIARDRSPVRLHLVSGRSPGSGVVVDATIDRVGADFVEVAAHAPGEVRRRDEVRESELIPLGALAAVRRSV
jgi:hypothetical protein